MKLICIKYFLFTFIAGLLTFLASCNSFRRYDDAIRIKETSSSKYYQLPGKNGLRDGGTLRGTAVGVIIESFPDSCPIDDSTKWMCSRYLVFLDEKSPEEKELFEKIPLDDIELVSSLFTPVQNKYGNINLFENYNNPDRLKSLREVPVDSIQRDTCCPCSCQPWGIDLGFDLDLSLKCPERTFRSFFLELRGAYAVYSDFSSQTTKIGRDAWPLEIAAGLRFGGMKEWGLGLAFSSGTKSYNSFKAVDLARPVILLHGRYQSPRNNLLGLCMLPFIYGQFGIALDKLSFSLFDFNFNTKCVNCKKVIEDLSAKNLIPGLDLSLPLSFGIGAGLDFPIASFMDLSFDAGFRSLAFGESMVAAGFDNVPSMRRINMLIFRFGLTF